MDSWWTWFDRDSVVRFTRKQALADGALVDVTEWGSAQSGFVGGFMVPVAVTAAVWTDLTAGPSWETVKDLRQRAHELLWMASRALRGGVREASFELILPVEGDVRTPQSNGGNSSHTREYRIMCGSNDDGSPCLTILKAEECRR
jgi:hypothetical protein